MDKFNYFCDGTKIRNLYAQEEPLDMIDAVGDHGFVPSIRVLGQSPQEILNIILDLK